MNRHHALSCLLALGIPLLAPAHSGSETAAVEKQAPIQKPATAAKSPAAPIVAGLRIEFRLDPRITRGTHMGERWVAESTHKTARQPGREGTVEARVVGLDSKGRLIDKKLEAVWLPADPQMLEISPTSGHRVRITVKRPGESSVRVVSGAVSNILLVRARYEGEYDATQLEISQKPVPGANPARAHVTDFTSKIFTAKLPRPPAND